MDLPLRQIRADFDRDTIVVYQAYNDQIADAALRHGRFAEPFSRSRMTWVKPSFLWMMERSGWGTKVLKDGDRSLATRLLPPQREYLVASAEVAGRLGLDRP